MSDQHQRIRKQMYDLTEADYRGTAVWEFCLDEESEEGQDEATVRPSELKDIPANSHGSFLLAADVVFGDGSKRLGYLFSDEHDINSAMGAVFINDRRAIFSIPGSFSGEKVKQYVEEQYQNIGMDRESVFPVSFRSIVPVAGRYLSFALDGFIFNGGSRKGETIR